MPAWQTPLAQSAALAQPLPSAHTGHTPPPQSTSDSAPFFSLSVQLGSGASGAGRSVVLRSRAAASAAPSCCTGGVSSSLHPQSSAAASRKMPTFFIGGLLGLYRG